MNSLFDFCVELLKLSSKTRSKAYLAMFFYDCATNT